MRKTIGAFLIVLTTVCFSILGDLIGGLTAGFLLPFFEAITSSTVSWISVVIIRILRIAIFGSGILAVMLLTTIISQRFNLEERIAFYLAGGAIIILAIILVALSGESGGIGYYVIAAMIVFGMGKSKEKEIFPGCQIPNPENTQMHDYLIDDKCLNDEVLQSTSIKDIVFESKDENASVVKVHGDESKNKKKVRFCKFCGGEIDSKTKRCTSCGKTTNPLKRFFDAKFVKPVLLVIFSLCLICSVGVNIYSLQQIDTLEKKITTKDKKIRDLRTEYAKVKNEKNQLEQKANFMDNHIVIVPDDGKGKYHKYGCNQLSNSSASSFWAYNTEAAKSKGYRACKECCD